MFVATAVCFWWGLVYGRYGRAGYGATVAYVMPAGTLLTALGLALFMAWMGKAARREKPVAAGRAPEGGMT